MAQLLDGLRIAAQIKNELRARVSTLKRHGIHPGLGTLLVGDDPASRSYVLGKHHDCEEVGVASTALELPAGSTTEEILAAVETLNADPAVTGFIVQLPLPDGVDEQLVLESIDPQKDADGLHPTNLGRLVSNIDPSRSTDTPLPCTPRGIIELIERHGLTLPGKKVTVIGRGITVGRPLGLLLTRKGCDATVTLTHSRTTDLPGALLESDVVVAAIGSPHFVQKQWLRPGAIVLDVGVTRVGTTAAGRARLAGDVHPDGAEVAGWISPNPGGVGPMTRAMLVTNVVEAAERRLEREGAHK